MILKNNYPAYLVKDIKAFEEAKARNDFLNLDLYSDELYGSINSAWIDGDITEIEASLLREIYLGL